MTQRIFTQKIFLLSFGILLFPYISFSQNPVTSIITTTSAATASSYTIGSDTYSWGEGDDLILTGFQALGNTYDRDLNLNKEIVFKRIDNSIVSGVRCRIFAERNGSTLNFVPSFPNDGSGECAMITALEEPIINRGALDVFHNVNAGTQHANNIERVDVLHDSLVAPVTALLSEIGFLATEKSGNNDYQLAVILSLNALGEPASYGSLVYIDGKNSGTPDSYGDTPTTYEFRFMENEEVAPRAEPFGYGGATEAIGASFISFADLGITEGQKIYGVSFFGKDVNTTSHTLTDPASFPDNTSEGADIHGGFGSLFSTSNVDVASLIIQDTDKDGVANDIDLDDDNDGIADTEEDGGTGFEAGADADGDDIPNYLDDNDVTGGFPSFVDANSDGVNDVYDKDLDGLPDFIDLDADNDGLPDVIEAGGVDINGDGHVDYPTPNDPSSMIDLDGDGLADTYDDTDTAGGTVGWTNGTPIANLDSDSDGIKDALDLDADNDGIPDLVEAEGVDTNGDGRVDNLTDSDSDGFADLVDPNDDGPDAGTGNTGTPNVATDNSANRLDGVSGTSLDSDLDGLPDGLDLDADNDGIPDIVEAGGIDANGDGRVESATDVDQDGLADVYDENATDGPGPDGTNGTALVETDGSGNFLDGSGNSVDTDGDGRADHLDLDADNDGIADLIEAGGVNIPGDGLVDFGAAPADEDGDGLIDIYDSNASDGPAGTGTNGTALVKTMSDSNGDGVVNAGEEMISGGTNNINMDGDNVPNHLDLDADNDGIVDIIETGGTDSDGDGMVDGLPTNDADGWLDAMNGVITTTPDAGDGNPYPDYSTGAGNPDFDGDGLANYLDIDADNDGIVDNTEGQSTSGYTAPTTDSDGDGLNDAYEVAGTIGIFGGVGIIPVNTETVDLADYLDLDADNDGESDLVEGHDSDNDGAADSGSLANTGEPTGLDIDFDGLDDGFDNNTSSTDPTNNGLNPTQHPDTPDSGVANRDWRATNRNIGGIVWEDLDEDGILDAGEPGISGATVTIFDDSDVQIAQVTTNPDGSYLVTDLPEDTYYIVFTKPAAYSNRSPQDAAGDDSIDSDGDVSGSQTGDYIVLTGSAERYVSSGFFGASLPVELSSFGGKALDCQIILNWTAETEVNFDFYEVQRSEDGMNFGPIDRVNGTNTRVRASYKYQDISAATNNYYRLKMVDLDRTYKYSKIIFVSTNCETEHPINLYPNPVLRTAGTIVNLRFFAEAEITEIFITDVSGQVVNGFNLNTSVDEWNNLVLDLSALPVGMYFLKDTNNRRPLRFIITE